MKSVITAIIIAAAVFFGGIYSSRAVENMCDMISEKTDSMIESINNQNFDTAYKILTDVDKILDKNTILLDSYIDHNEIDKIETSIATLKAYIKEQDKSPALANANILVEHFTNLPKDYQIRLENIF